MILDGVKNTIGMEADEAIERVSTAGMLVCVHEVTHPAGASTRPSAGTHDPRGATPATPSMAVDFRHDMHRIRRRKRIQVEIDVDVLKVGADDNLRTRLVLRTHAKG